jgi:hypothetical protein
MNMMIAPGPDTKGILLASPRNINSARANIGFDFSGPHAP